MKCNSVALPVSTGLPLYRKKKRLLSHSYGMRFYFLARKKKRWYNTFMMKEHFLSELIKKETERKIKVTVYLPVKLVKKAKHTCIDLDITLSEFIEKAIESYLKITETQVKE